MTRRVAYCAIAAATVVEAIGITLCIWAVMRI